MINRPVVETYGIYKDYRTNSIETIELTANLSCLTHCRKKISYGHF